MESQKNTQFPKDIILKVEQLTMKFGGLIAIHNLNFDIERNKITAIIGPNGAGKTTLFNCITGFYQPYQGRLLLQQAQGNLYSLEKLTNFQITKKAKVTRTFQNIRLFKGLTVLENLMIAQHNQLRDNSLQGLMNSLFHFLGVMKNYEPEKQALEKAKFWLEKINLVDRADDLAASLPYGDQRRLEIVRAMCTDPQLLCLDEPAAGLNPHESLILNQLLLDICKETSTSILLIEHDMSVVMNISDHIIVLDYGRKIADGSPETIRNHPAVIAAYLGIEDEEASLFLDPQQG